ncbi:coiled-coil domain-containing protein [Methylobacterium oryzae]|uniref:coiled-coil domain-containing protein n=1 Tax=Methylobacterium oryzae TaxID=334852 RepID=UPI001F200CE9|nr:coiled-coil domain-containing protein [Methylobacterium oryzae]UIN35475.1 CCDC90 family protein [Methylobacterium oryzae]
MTAVAFDTLKFARVLREKAKLSPEQAEGLADALVDVFDGNLATKADIRDVQAELQIVRGDIEALKIQTRGDIEALRLTTQADIEGLRISTKADSDSLRQSTKSDIEALRLSTKADIDSLRLETKADIEAVKGAIASAKVETVRWLVGAIGFQTLAVLGAVITLTRTLH